MRKGWEYKKLGEIAKCAIGLTYKPENVTEELSGTIVLRSSNIQNSILDFNDIVRVNVPVKEDKIVKDGDILMCSRNGSIRLVGKVALIKNLKERMSYGAFMTIIRSQYNPYLFEYFKTPAFRQYLIAGKTTTVNQITVKMLNNLTIPLPPKSTQLAIVSELDKINELIRLKKEQLKDFDNLAQSLFYEMFGEGKCLRKKLKNIVKIQSGQVSPLEKPYSEMIHVGPANIESNTGRLLNLKTAKEENLISGKYLFNSSMVLYSKIRPNLNKVAIPSFEGICSADMYPIIPLECIDKNFLLFLLKQKEFLTYAISNSGRANIPKINREALLNYEAILPPLSLQRLFAQRIEQIEREKSEVQKSIQDLETLLASRMQYWFE